MTVFVLEVGEYSQRGVHGVFATAELAMAGYPHGTWIAVTDDGVTWWSNDYGDTATVCEFEVRGAKTVDVATKTAQT